MDNLIVFQDEHHLVSESAVVGFPHDVKGEGKIAHNAHHFVIIRKSQVTEE